MKPRSELATRAISGLLLASVVLFITWWNPIAFDMMCLLGGLILTKEWSGLTKTRGPVYLLFGAVYIGLALASLMLLRHIDLRLIFKLFALVWSADIGGYVIGKWLGNHKIAPSVSPGKSWEGLAGSILFSSGIAFAFMQRDFYYTLWHAVPFTTMNYILFCLATGTAFSIIGLLGDLFESKLKRRAGVKDSGRLIPGHGGLFDRVDALLPCSIFMVFFALTHYMLAFAQMRP